MYKDKQMSWGNVNANGMSEAVNQAAHATALLQEANKGLSGIGDSIAKVGDSMTKYGTDMETRYEKEKNEVIEGIANDIYNSAIADSTDANGRVNFDTFDKVTAMSMANLRQGKYAMNEKDHNAVLKHVNSLIDRSATTKDNVSIMDTILNRDKYNFEVTQYDDKQQYKHFDTLQRRKEMTLVSLTHGLENAKTPEERTRIINLMRLVENPISDENTLKQINKFIKEKHPNNKKEFSADELNNIVYDYKSMKKIFGNDTPFIYDMILNSPYLSTISALFSTHGDNNE